MIELAIVWGALIVVALFAWGALRRDADFDEDPPESVLNRMWKGERHD